MFDTRTIRNFIEFYEENNGEVVNFATRKVVCWRCRGNGTHTNPAIDGNGITSEEWGEWGDDEREGYLTGRYDVTCDECHGANVLDEIDESRCDPTVLAVFHAYMQEEADYAAEVAAERRMGA